MMEELVKNEKDYKNLCHPYVLNFSDKKEIKIDKEEIGELYDF
jgi:hypothetical protein